MEGPLSSQHKHPVVGDRRLSARGGGAIFTRLCFPHYSIDHRQARVKEPSRLPSSQELIDTRLHSQIQRFRIPGPPEKNPPNRTVPISQFPETGISFQSHQRVKKPKITCFRKYCASDFSNGTIASAHELEAALDSLRDHGGLARRLAVAAAGGAATNCGRSPSARFPLDTEPTVRLIFFASPRDGIFPRQTQSFWSNLPADKRG